MKKNNENTQKASVKKNVKKSVKRNLVKVKEFLARSSQHPNHSQNIPRLKRAMGQLSGIENMILDRRYCAEILQQLKAVQSAIQAIELEIFKTHLSHCLHSSAKNKSDDIFNKQLHELLNLIKK